MCSKLRLLEVKSEFGGDRPAVLDPQFWTRSSGPAVSVQPTSCQQGQQQFPPMILLPSTPLFNDIINSVIKEGNGRKLLV